MPDEVIDTLVGKIGQTEMGGKEHAEQPIEDVAQRFARGHLVRGRLPVLPRSGARGVQLSDDPIEIPMRARDRAVAGLVAAGAHAASPLASKTPSNRAELR